MNIVRMSGCVVAAVAFAATSSFAVADTVMAVTPEQQQAVASVAGAGSINEPVKIVCKTTKQLGTRLGGKRVCKSADEWREEGARDQRMIREQQQLHTMNIRD